MPTNIKQENQNISEFNQFLQNNNDLLLEKYRQYFVIDSIPINTIDPDTVVKFISDIFAFDRYEDVQMRHKISSSLKQNFKQFVELRKGMNNFTSALAIDLLKFCIQNNKMFAVKYEKGLNNREPDSPKKTINAPSLQQQKNNQQNPQIQLLSAADSNQNKSNQTNQFADEGFKRNNSFIENQFQFHEDIKYDFDPVLINKNIVTMFEYYCKQQMALKPNLSFQRIQQQSKTLTLSKLLLMARMMNILNSVITKQVLTNKFRAVSGGKTKIDLKKFQIMFNQLQILDPTLVARAQLNSHHIQTNLKTTKKPFDTQDTNPRQLIKNRPFNRKLTMHSGYMQQDLKAQLQTRKSQSLLPQHVKKMRKYQQIITQAKSRYQNHMQSSIITTKKLVSGSRGGVSSDIGVMKHIISQKDDDKYLQEYRIKPPYRKNRSIGKEHSPRSSMMIQQLKNRVRQLQKTEQQSSNNMEQTRPYLYSPLKKI